MTDKPPIPPLKNNESDDKPPKYIGYCLECGKFKPLVAYDKFCSSSCHVAYAVKKEEQQPQVDKAKTETVSPGVDQVPYASIERIGAIFAEGEIKYGRDNWKKGVGDTEFQEERIRHMIRHLFLYANGDRTEDHLAKVGWGSVALMELKRLEEQE